MAFSKKFIAFDLDTKALQENYPTPSSWRNAYTDIRTFMEKNDFTHQQGSAYISKLLLQDKDIVKLSQNLVKQCLWLDKCVKHINVTDIAEVSFDLQPIILATAKQVRKYHTNTKKPKAKLMPRRKNSETKIKTLTR